jgi:hypothetical protein
MNLDRFDLAAADVEVGRRSADLDIAWDGRVAAAVSFRSRS